MNRRITKMGASSMSRRFWRFAIISLIGIVLAAVILEVFSMHILERQLTAQGVQQHKTLAWSLANSLQERLLPLSTTEPGPDPEDMRARPEVGELRQLLKTRLENLDVAKLKLYTLEGLTVFSTDPAQIGELQDANPGVRHAAAGVPVSNIVHKDTMNTFDGVIEDRNLVQSYLPYRNTANDVMGVFEIYSDITPLLERIGNSRRLIMVTVIGILGLFYVALVGLYARVDRAQQRELATRKRHLREIEQSNATLEQRVTERTREIEQSRSFLQAVMDGVTDPVVVINTDFRVTAMNQAARDQLPAVDDQDGEVYCFRTMHHRDSPCDGRGHTCTIKEVMNTGAPCQLLHTHYLPNNEARRFEVMASPLRNQDGEIIGAVEVNHDITRREALLAELEQAKEVAEQANEAKSAFVARVCHEVRTPMNAIIGMTDLLQQTRLTRKQQEYLRIIQDSGDMLLTEVDGILDFAHLEAGNLTLEKRVFDLGELLESVLETMSYQAYSKGLELTGRMLPPNQPRVWGDSDRLRQVLLNLVSNAVRCTDRGQVQILIQRISETDGKLEVCFEVRDSGPGLDKAIEERLFKPLRPIDIPRSHGKRSSGLGLMICKQLVDCMHGQIGVRSQAGEGATFWFSVSLETVASNGTPYPTAQAELAGRRVLVAAAHPDVSTMLCETMNNWGMHCEEAVESREMLQRLQQAAGTTEAFDCAVIDVNLKDSCGITQARTIRMTPSFAGLPLVLLCSVARPLEIGTVSSLTRTRCLNKPALPSRLAENLLAVLRPGEPDPADPEAGSAQILVEQRNSTRILVAEDNTLSSRILVEMLHTLGFQADSVSDGPGVLKAVQQIPYDLIIMDSQMPGMDGPEVTRLIRGYGARLPRQPLIVALSADITERHQTACLEAGMNEFIGKPLRLEKLEAGVRRWLPQVAPVQIDTGATAPPAISDADLRAALEKTFGKWDEAFIEECVSLFMKDATRRTRAMDAALRAGEYGEAQRHAHAFKGSCMQVGLERLGACCEALREATADGRMETALLHLREIQGKLETIGAGAGVGR